MEIQETVIGIQAAKSEAEDVHAAIQKMDENCKCLWRINYNGLFTFLKRWMQKVRSMK